MINHGKTQLNEVKHGQGNLEHSGSFYQNLFWSCPLSTLNFWIRRIWLAYGVGRRCRNLLLQILRPCIDESRCVCKSLMSHTILWVIDVSHDDSTEKNELNELSYWDWYSYNIWFFIFISNFFDDRIEFSFSGGKIDRNLSWWNFTVCHICHIRGTVICHNTIWSMFPSFYISFSRHGKPACAYVRGTTYASDVWRCVFNWLLMM